MSFKYAQLQPFTLAGAGANITDQTIVLSSMKSIDGVALAMTDFGTIGFATLEPGNGIQEEQISFSGITQNSNGTATLTGVKTVLLLSPYTQTAGLTKTHAGGTALVISNTSGFYDEFVSKANDSTITGQITFTQPPIGVNPGGAADASTTVKGVTKISCAPVSASSPIALGENDARVPTSNQAAALVGTGTPSASDKYVNRSTLTSEEAAFELLSNKNTSTSLGTSNTLYPTQNAVKTYVDNQTTNVYLGSQALSNGANTITAGYQSAWRYAVIQLIDSYGYAGGQVIIFKTGVTSGSFTQYILSNHYGCSASVSGTTITIGASQGTASGTAYYYQ